MEGVLVDRYVLEEVIGRGGMSEVYAAQDERLGRAVAVKFLDASLVQDQAACERFMREARSAARVAHPNIVTVFDTGIDEGRPFIVMERLPGETLAGEIRRGPVDAARATQVLTDILQGLDAAHRAGVLHRDVKPGNVLCARDGTVKVADFGIAKVADSVDSTFTTGLIATPAYLAPERLSGAPATPQSDIFSVGVIGYELLSGVRPFHRDSPGAVLAAIHRGEHTSIEERVPDAPAALVGSIERALAREPAARFGSAAEMLGELCQVEADQAAVTGAGLEATDPHTEPVDMATLPVTKTRVMQAAPPRPDTTSIRPRPVRRRPHQARRWMPAVAVVVLAMLIVGGVIALTRGGGDGVSSNDPVVETPSSAITGVPAAVELPPSLERSLRELESAVGR